jgi:hypothetical protein
VIPENSENTYLKIILKKINIPSSFVSPVIASGIFLGIHIVKLFPEKAYRYFVIITTLGSSVLLFL